jgi:hypothetical protein
MKRKVSKAFIIKLIDAFQRGDQNGVRLKGEWATAFLVNLLNSL